MSAQQDKDLKLQEIEVSINDVDSIESQQLLRDALKGVPAVRAVRIVRGGAMVSYNPLGTSVEVIRSAIERAGFTIDGIEAGQQSNVPIGANSGEVNEIWRGPQGRPQQSGFDVQGIS